MALNLAAPHTWPAAIMPAFVATVIASRASSISVTMAMSLLLIVILMQSAVNTFNDYYDYVKGTDSDDDFVDPSDAVLVYNNINPKAALALAIGFLVVAFALGVYAIVQTGITPLIIGIIGAVFVVAYSAGSSPISYLPLGEIVSGVVMGALIPLAIVDVLTGQLDFLVLVESIPLVIAIGLIMFTNNVSDIERDEPAGRRTLPVLLGRGKAVRLYHVLVIVWIAFIVGNIAIFNTVGLIVVPFMLLASYPLLAVLFKNPFTPDRRLQSMPQILNLNIVLGAFYAAGLLVGVAFSVVL